MTPKNIHTLKYPGFTLVEALVAIAIIALLALILIPVVSSGMMVANRSVCASNQRQIGTALQLYATEHDGEFPQSSHSIRKEKAWIYGLESYLENVDEVRVCPADPAERQEDILRRNATSYILNDLVFDRLEHHNLFKLPNPSRTLLLCVLSEDRTPSLTRDHIHGDEWISWYSMLSDIEPDRHRTGERSKERTTGSSNYLYADGHVETIDAGDMKRLIDSGVNPAIPPG